MHQSFHVFVDNQNNFKAWALFCRVNRRRGEHIRSRSRLRCTDMKATKQKMRQIENGKLSREKRMHDWKQGLKVSAKIITFMWRKITNYYLPTKLHLALMSCLTKICVPCDDKSVPYPTISMTKLVVKFAMYIYSDTLGKLWWNSSSWTLHRKHKLFNFNWTRD